MRGGLLKSLATYHCVYCEWRTLVTFCGNKRLWSGWVQAGSARCRRAWTQPTKTVNMHHLKMWLVSDEHIRVKMIIREHLFLAPCVWAAGGEGWGTHKCTTTADWTRKASSNGWIIVIKCNSCNIVKNDLIISMYENNRATRAGISFGQVVNRSHKRSGYWEKRPLPWYFDKAAN